MASDCFGDKESKVNYYGMMVIKSKGGDDGDDADMIFVTCSTSSVK